MLAGQSGEGPDRILLREEHSGGAPSSALGWEAIGDGHGRKQGSSDMGR